MLGFCYMDHTGSVAQRRRTLIIADDHPVFRDGLRSWITRDQRLEIVGEAHNARTLQELVLRCRPDLVVMDLALGGEDGIEILRRFRAEHPSVAVLILAQGDELAFGDRALRAGALGYVMKTATGEEILAAIHRTLQGEIHVSGRLAPLMIKRLWHGAEGGDPATRLSDRELQVFRLIGSGIGTSQIARRLRLSVKTVEAHRHHIKQKLGLRNAPALTHAATLWVNQRRAALEPA